jgi:hypothetical protein
MVSRGVVFLVAVAILASIAAMAVAFAELGTD